MGVTRGNKDRARTSAEGANLMQLSRSGNLKELTQSAKEDQNMKDDGYLGNHEEQLPRREQR